VSKMNYQK